MDDLISIFVTWQFVFFSLGIAAATFVVRKVLEFYVLQNPKLPGSKDSKFWTDLFLPTMPIILGGILGYFVTMYPFPEGLMQSDYGRIAFGSAAGLVSGFFYRVIKSALLMRISISKKQIQDNGFEEKDL